ncbi:MAG: cytochrome c biogenesis protein CcsA [Bacteriovoracaceae bacterium]|jgi:cytochrome c-type biogenesis protein CcsB|nr:cytochrome c biogenesis protein CcsA [Bacteriovoracaceae bacterium]
MLNLKKIIAAILLILATPLYANPCGNWLESLPILGGGRIKPLAVHAGETLKFLTNKRKPQGEDSVTTYCNLATAYMNHKNIPKLTTPVQHEKIREIMELKKGQSSIDLMKLADYSTAIRSKYFGEKLDSPYKKALSKQLTRIQITKSIINGEDWKIPSDKSTTGFRSIKDIFADESDFVASGRTQLEDAKNAYIAKNGDKYLVELTYSKLHIFSWAMLLVLAGIFALTLFKSQTPGLVISLLVIIVQVIGISIRVYISGRAPITNMYETVMFSGFGALVIGTIIAMVKKEKIFIVCGLAYNMLCLMMMMFANSMLSPSIKPLVPVLRSNFWLSTHVTTIMLSYAALALSWILANIVLVKKRFKTVEDKELRYEVTLIHTCIKVGVVLLAAGIILGGIWADYSWGRFWGWDPKETWSLIVLLIYMAILHGKQTNWIPPKRFTAMVAGAFMSVMMAWFGVNYILASGLHSYGFSEGGAIFLATFFIIQIAVIVLASFGGKKKALPST